MDTKDEMLIIAEKALRNLNIAAKDAKMCGGNLSATFVEYSVEHALKQLQRLRQRTR